MGKRFSAPAQKTSGISPERFVFRKVGEEFIGRSERLDEEILEAEYLGVVHGHKGTIRVDSAPGKGATFRLLLPAETPL